MEKNTVMMDLDRYEGIMESMTSLKMELKELKEAVRNKILISKDEFSIVEDDGKYELCIDAKAIGTVVKILGGYTAKSSFYDKLKIGSYQLKITKEEE